MEMSNEAGNKVKIINEAKTKRVKKTMLLLNRPTILTVNVEILLLKNEVS